LGKRRHWCDLLHNIRKQKSNGFPDQIAWTRIPITPPEGKSGTFAFNLPPEKGNIKAGVANNALQIFLPQARKPWAEK